MEEVDLCVETFGSKFTLYVNSLKVNKYITHPYATKIKHNLRTTRMCQDTAPAFTPSHSQTHNV